MNNEHFDKNNVWKGKMFMKMYFSPLGIAHPGLVYVQVLLQVLQLVNIAQNSLLLKVSMVEVMVNGVDNDVVDQEDTNTQLPSTFSYKARHPQMKLATKICEIIQ